MSSHSCKPEEFSTLATRTASARKGEHPPRTGGLHYDAKENLLGLAAFFISQADSPPHIRCIHDRQRLRQRVLP